MSLKLYPDMYYNACFDLFFALLIQKVLTGQS